MLLDSYVNIEIPFMKNNQKSLTKRVSTNSLFLRYVGRGWRIVLFSVFLFAISLQGALILGERFRLARAVEISVISFWNTSVS